MLQSSCTAAEIFLCKKEIGEHKSYSLNTTMMVISITFSGYISVRSTINKLFKPHSTPFFHSHLSTESVP
uniref:Uncharacterized protein n=1 Tax=Arion vulgaris TaxID=1028688 RepID=A0A0B7APQ0_9EUPU